MEQALALETLAGGEVDDDLVQAIQSLADATSSCGARYEPRVIRILVQLVAARAYGRPLLELAHLLSLADRLGGRHGAAGFFWSVERASGQAFRQVLTAGLARDAGGAVEARLEAEGVRLHYGDGQFLIHFGRVPLLAAVYEFLVVTIGYEAVTAASKMLMRGRPSVRAAAGCANDLSRLLYDYLRGRLPGAQHQRQHRRLVDHMARERGAAFSVEDIDDAAVLSFWTSVAERHRDTPTEVKSVRTIVVAFLQFRRAFQAVGERRSIEAARPIGADREAGEVDPDALGAVLETLEEEADWLSILTAEPFSAVKFLNKRESERLELIVRHGRHAAALALSVLRAEIFGDMQGRLTEARRRHKSVQEMRALIDEGPVESHAQRVQALQKLVDHVGNCRLATLHVLIRHQTVAALGLLLDLFPDVDLGVPGSGQGAGQGSDDGAGQRCDGDAKVVPIHAKRLLRDLTSGTGALASRAADAARGFAAISRQGFSEAAVADPDHAALFMQAVPGLAAIAASLNFYLAQALDGTPSQTLDEQMVLDRTVFADTFRNLYGGP